MLRKNTDTGNSTLMIWISIRRSIINNSCYKDKNPCWEGEGESGKGNTNTKPKSFSIKLQSASYRKWKVRKEEKGKEIPLQQHKAEGLNYK